MENDALGTEHGRIWLFNFPLFLVAIYSGSTPAALSTAGYDFFCFYFFLVAIDDGIDAHGTKHGRIRFLLFSLLFGGNFWRTDARTNIIPSFSPFPTREAQFSSGTVLGAQWKVPEQLKPAHFDHSNEGNVGRINSWGLFCTDLGTILADRHPRLWARPGVLLRFSPPQ